LPKYVVGTVDEIPPGSRKIVEVGGRSVGVFNVRGEYFALLNRCPHQGGPLCLGRAHGLLRSGGVGEYDYSRPGEMLRCPWHGWEYDMRTGQSWFDPRGVLVRTYDVSVAAGAELQKGPYVAETFPVSVEHEYVLVEMRR
jgi:nitrite reductase/ring-hydroxylating ferredoxin subunit